MYDFNIKQPYTIKCCNCDTKFLGVWNLPIVKLDGEYTDVCPQCMTDEFLENMEVE